MDPLLKIQLGEGALEPKYATDGAAGMDVCTSHDFTIDPFERKLVSTGLRLAIPSGFEAQVRPRSGLALNHGVALVNSPGTIDSDYRGELGVIMINLGQTVVEFKRGDRIAQLIIAPVVRADIEIVADLDATSRGEGGFGSTGK